MNICKYRAHERFRQIKQCFDVALGDEKRMPGKQRTVIEEGQREIVLENFVARHGAANNLAESAIGIEDGVEGPGISRRIFHLAVCFR